MAKKVLTSLDLGCYVLKGLRLENIAKANFSSVGFSTASDGSKLGRILYDTTDNKVKYIDNSKIQVVATADDLGGYLSINEAALNYMSLANWAGIKTTYDNALDELYEKQDAIEDLDTIRSNASNGNTAFGWGNHASAGYASGSTLMTLDGRVQTLEDALGLGAEADDTINAWNEVVNFLAGYKENDTLAGTLASMDAAISGKLSPASITANTGNLTFAAIFNFLKVVFKFLKAISCFLRAISYFLRAVFQSSCSYYICQQKTQCFRNIRTKYQI